MRAVQQLTASVGFVRHHRPAYTGTAVLLCAATVISTAEMVLYTGFVTGAAVDTTGLSEFDVRTVHSSIRASQGILQVMCFTTVVVALVLVFLGLRNMLDLRRRELGQMRLAGGSVLRIRTMIVLEALIFSVIVVIPSVIVGGALAHPFYLLLQTVGVFGRSLRADFGFPVLTLLAVAAGMIVCAAVAAWLSFRPRQTANVLDALTAAPTGKTATRMSLLRIVVASASVIGLASFLIFMPDTGGENPVASVVVPLLIVFPLGALAPLLVPGVATTLALLLRPIIRGSGLLVAQRANRDARRFASNVLPLLILVGVMGGFTIGAGADQATMRADYQAQVGADLIAQPETVAQADVLASEAASDPRVLSVMRSASTTRLLEPGREDGTFLTVFNFVDLAAYSDALTAHVTAGSLDGLHGTQVASARESDELGDTIEVEAPNGATVQFEVAALVSSRIYTGILIDWESMKMLDPEVWDLRTFLTVAPSQAADVATELSETAPVLTKDQFVQTRVDVRQSNASTGNIALFGTVYALAVVAMTQGVAASVLSRRPEFRLLSLLGISRGRIIVMLLSETLILVITSAILLTAALAFIAWRYLSTATDMVAEALGSVSWGSIALTFAGMAVLFAMTVLLAGVRATNGRRS